MTEVTPNLPHLGNFCKYCFMGTLLSVTPYFEAGNIHFPKPETAPWVHDTIQDLLMFPKGEYKDDIDALVQAILYLMDKPAKSPPKAEAMLSKSSYWRR